MPSQALIDQLETRRQTCQQRAETILARAKADGRDTLTPQEDAEVHQHIETLRTLSQRITDETEELRRGQIPAHLRHLSHATQDRRSTPMNPTSNVYRPHGQTSYFRDLARVQCNMDDTSESRRRLAAHAEEIATDFGTEYRDISRVDGTGGYFSPPAWLVNQYIEFARPGRPTANLAQRLPLPGGCDNLNLPKILTGTQTGIQTADNTAVTDVDLTDTFVNLPVRTLAGQQGISIQLIDQSPVAMDDVIFKDLTADHAMRLDQQILYGTGSSGQVLGIANTPGIQTVTVSSLDIKGVYSAIANAIQLINTTRYLPPEVIVMHPRRFSWLMSLLDLQNRPLFVPDANGPFNAAGVIEDVDPQQIVGRTHGLPIVVDANIKTTAGAGTEDEIYVMRSSDLVLYESGLRARVLPEPKAATLTVLCQVYGYLAFSAARFPQSVVQLTGLLPPTF